MIESFGDPENRGEAADNSLIVVGERGVGDVMTRGNGLAIVIAHQGRDNRAIAAFQTGDVAVQGKILAMFVVPAVANHMADIVQQRGCL